MLRASAPCQDNIPALKSSMESLTQTIFIIEGQVSGRNCFQTVKLNGRYIWPGHRDERNKRNILSAIPWNDASRKLHSPEDRAKEGPGAHAKNVYQSAKLSNKAGGGTCFDSCSYPKPLLWCEKLVSGELSRMTIRPNPLFDLHHRSTIQRFVFTVCLFVCVEIKQYEDEWKRGALLI